MTDADGALIDDVQPVIPRAFTVGIASGMRSWPPLAALALNYDSAPAQAAWRRWPVFRSPLGRTLLIAMGATEFVTDKLPGTQPRIALTVQPSRIDSGLVGRLAFAGIAGAAIGSEHGGRNSIVAGAALAVAGAILTNYAGYFARTAGVEATGVPNMAVSLAEDAATVALLAAAVPVETMADRG
ncbi:DUF4126 family protein [Geminicoccus harenae]|uniref:DUF4126 family protein n=1 Tax=Geminicoccus harenae TaxID=2498453 RepID=UPI00168AD84A|nr:DUF4126 family protein [Geminicoccus harenae]